MADQTTVDPLSIIKTETIAKVNAGDLIGAMNHFMDACYDNDFDTSIIFSQLEMAVEAKNAKGMIDAVNSFKG